MNISTRLTALVVALSAFLAAQSTYLPLSAGKKWVLKGGGNAQMIFEVVEAANGAYRVHWDNPFIQSEFHLVPKGGKYILNALTMNGQTANMPPDTVYWDLDAPKGASWSSAIGKLVVTDRSRTIKGKNGTVYSNCVVIQETNKQGNKLFWIFAPNVGFVQFGEGGGAFVLESMSQGNGRVLQSNNAPRPAETTKEPPRRRGSDQQPPPRSAGRGGGEPVWIGLAANTFANEPFDGKSIKTRFEQSLRAGVSYIYLSPKWNEVEPKKGQISFKDIDYQIGQAVSYGIPAVMHLRVIDTNQRSMPSDLMGKRLNDQAVKDRLGAVLESIVKRTNGKVKHYLVGNEIDGYFKGHKGDVQDYAELVGSAIAKIKATQSDALVSVSTGFDGLDILSSTLQPIVQQTDFLAVTYYPLRPDFTVRDVSTVKGDLAKIVDASGGKKILLQEVGYPSDPKTGSSEDKQAQFFATFLDEMQSKGGKIIGANVCFMSDFSDELADTFVKYYKAAGADKFRAFLKTLGLFNDQGQPKKSWSVFEDRTRRVTGKGN